MGFYDYIKTLPQTLSKEEERSLLSIYSTTKREDVRQLLIEHNLRLVAGIVLEFEGRADLDDYMQIGTIELMKDLDKFDISRGYEFVNYASTSIRGRLYNEFNRSKRTKEAMLQNVVSIDSITEKDKDIDKIIQDDGLQEYFAEKDIFDRFLNTLDDEDRYIIEHELGLWDYEKLNNWEKVKLRSIGELRG